MSDKIIEPVEPKKLRDERIGLAEYKRSEWFVTAEAGTTIEEVLCRDYWSHVSRSMRPYDRITVAIDTGEWMLDLHVHSAGQNWANVTLLHHYKDLRPAAVDALSEQGSSLETKWRGPHSKCAVIRKANGEVIKDKFDNEGLAQTYILNFEGRKAA